MVKFIITAIEALILLSIAILVFKSRRDSFINRSFSLFLVFLAFWLLCGFPHLLVSEPSTRFVTLQFRAAYCLAILAAGCFLLFGLSFYSGSKPRRIVKNAVILLSLILAFCCLSDLMIKSTTYEQGKYTTVHGSIFFLFPLFVILFAGGGLFFIALKRHRSLSTERARATYILLGFGIFLAVGFVLAIVLPAIMGSDTTSDYAFFLVIIPTGFMAYAILKHRLLDVRIAVRRSFAYLLTIVIFGAPLVATYSVFRYTLKANPNLEIAVSILALALAVALSPAVLRWTNGIASRLFFSGLYDDVELLHRISSIFTSTANIRDGLILATSLICEKLGLKKLVVVIPDEITRRKGNWLIGSQRGEDGIVGFQRVEKEPSPLYQLWDTLLVVGDSGSRPDNPNSSVVLDIMAAQGLAACVPVKGPAGKLAVLLVGEKAGLVALDPLDLDFLGQFAERAGLFIENYLLSTYLLTQFEELMEVRKRLEESDRFKTDVISVTSHEFRTPLTVLSGYALMLNDHYERFSEDERKQYLGYITSSCERLTDILDQFMTVSRFQKGGTKIAPQATALGEIFYEIKSGFMPEQSERIESVVEPGDISVLTDRSYLTLMLKNLVENAIRFSPKEQPVIMHAEEIDREVIIWVQDFGEGMKPNEIESIFEPFTRLEEINQHRIGTGLGLYIVRLVADLIGTKIGVETMQESGTTFYFKLPQA